MAKTIDEICIPLGIIYDYSIKFSFNSTKFPLHDHLVFGNALNYSLKIHSATKNAAIKLCSGPGGPWGKNITQISN